MANASSFGPYDVAARVGGGGGGVVYRATDRRTGAAVALKVVAERSEVALRAFRRELAALRSLDHPGIVRIVDDGIEDPTPWYAMELVAGSPLDEHCDALATDPLWRAAAPSMRASSEASGSRPDLSFAAEPAFDAPSAEPARGPRPRAGGGALAPVLAVLRRVAEVLAFLHGEGLCHQDLTPRNIIVRPDGQPVLVDFGFSLRFDPAGGRERLDGGAAARGGTLAYMAPEQLAEGPVDGRADLFALGCIIYERVAGRAPFPSRGASDHALRQRARPAALASLVDGAPAELERLVRALLAHDPDERPGYASDVAEALGRLGAPGAPATRAARTYLYPPAIAGRDQELAWLTSALERAARGEGPVVRVVEGESGAGKTRLASELARRAARRGARIVTCEGAPPGGRGAAQPLGALHGLFEAISDLCRSGGPEAREALLGPREPVLRAFAPQLGEGPTAPVSRRTLARVLATTFAALAEDRPLLLLLDDVQGIDGLTREVLPMALRDPDGRRTRLLVCAMRRTGEADGVVDEWLERLAGERLALPRLDLQAVRRMTGSMLALAEPPPELLSFLDRHAEGNPLFVAEYLRAAVSAEALQRDARGRWTLRRLPSEETPRSVSAIVRRRLEPVSEEARPALEAAAVIGRAFDEPLLAAVLGEALPPASLLELTRRGLLEEDRSGSLRFTHDKLRERAYADLGSSRRRALHRATALALADGDAEPGERGRLRAGAVAEHWERAGEPSRAARWFVEAAEAAAASEALDDAKRLAGRALALVEAPDASRIRARVSIARVRMLEARIEEGLRETEDALEEARTLGEPRHLATVLVRRAVLLDRARRHDEAVAAAEEALSASEVAGSPEGVAWASLSLAQASYRRGDLAGLEAHSRRGLAAALEAGEPRCITQARRFLGEYHAVRGERALAREQHEASILLAREVGDVRQEARTLSALAAVLEGEEATACLERSCRLLLPLASLEERAEALVLLGGRYLSVGSLEEARATLEQAVRASTEGDLEKWRGHGMTRLAEIAWLMGERARARTLLAAARTVLANVTDPIAHFESLRIGALAESEEGEHDEAEALVARARAVASATRMPRVMAWLEVAATTVARRRGAPAEALLRALDDAAASMQGDPDLQTLATCERGHLALALGDLAAAGEALDRLDPAVSSRSPAGRLRARLAEAIEAARSGRSTPRGEVVHR